MRDLASCIWQISFFLFFFLCVCLHDSRPAFWSNYLSLQITAFRSVWHKERIGTIFQNFSVFDAFLLCFLFFFCFFACIKRHWIILPDRIEQPRCLVRTVCIKCQRIILPMMAIFKPGLDLSVRFLNLNCILPFCQIMHCPFHSNFWATHHPILDRAPWQVPPALSSFDSCLYSRPHPASYSFLSNHYTYYLIEPMMDSGYTEQPHLWVWFLALCCAFLLPFLVFRTISVWCHVSSVCSTTSCLIISSL